MTVDPPRRRARPTRHGRAVLALAVCLAPAVLSAPASAQLLPGFLVDPPGLEMFMDATYNSARDEYFITYAGDDALGLRLSPCGEVLDELSFFEHSETNGVNQVAVTYNPDRDEYLVVIRLNDPQEVFVRYLDSLGQPLTEPIPIVALPDLGGGPSVHYAGPWQRYLVRWGRGNQRSWYRMIDADSGSDAPVLTDRLELSATGFSSVASYGSGSDQFLTAFTVEEADGSNPNVVGRFISGDGLTIGPVFDLAAGPRSQQGAALAYAPSTDRWLLAVEDWSRVDQGHVADVLAMFVDREGQVGQSFYIAETGDNGWDVGGPMAYHPTSDLFYATFFLIDTTYYRTVDPATGALGPIQIVDIDNAAPEAIAVRPHALNPQVLFVWRRRFNGVHAGILNIAGACTDQEVVGGDADDRAGDGPGDGAAPSDAGRDDGLDGVAEAGPGDAIGDAAPGELDGTGGPSGEPAEDGGASSARLEGGCGCRTQTRTPPAGGAALAFGVLFAWTRRHRRRD